MSARVGNNRTLNIKKTHEQSTY